MIFSRTIILAILSVLLVFNMVSADEHKVEKNIIEKAKEINQQIKLKQANQSNNISSEVGSEEPLPLNDPFVGDASLSGRTEVTLLNDSNETSKPKGDLSLYNYKLVGVVSSEVDSFASLINTNGEVLTLKLFEELAPGVKLVAVDNREAVFERDEDSYLVINFKNQIVERTR